jgi:hypothetical protein
VIGAIAKFVGAKLLGKVLGGGRGGREPEQFSVYGKTFGRQEDANSGERDHSRRALAEEVAGLLLRRRREVDPGFTAPPTDTGGGY